MNKETAFWLAIFIICLVMTLPFLVKPLPIVYYSHTKQECVKILIEGIEYDCSEIPARYERIWVE